MVSGRMKNVVKKTSILLVIILMLAIPLVYATHYIEGEERNPRIIGDYTILGTPVQGKYYYVPSTLRNRLKLLVRNGNDIQVSQPSPPKGAMSNPKRTIITNGRPMVSQPRIGPPREAHVRAVSIGARTSMMNTPLDKLQQQHETAAELHEPDQTVQEMPLTTYRVIGDYTRTVTRRGRYYYTDRDGLGILSPVYIGPTKKKVAKPDRTFSVGGYAARYREEAIKRAQLR